MGSVRDRTNELVTRPNDEAEPKESCADMKRRLAQAFGLDPSQSIFDKLPCDPNDKPPQMLRDIERFRRANGDENVRLSLEKQIQLRGYARDVVRKHQDIADDVRNFFEWYLHFYGCKPGSEVEWSPHAPGAQTWPRQERK